MKTFLSLYVAAVFLFFSCTEKSSTLESKIDDTLKIAATQYQHLMNSLTKGQYPRTYFSDQDKLETSGSGWWCSGFYPGSLIYLNEDSKNPAFQKEIIRVLNDLKREQFNTTTHDLGFMMYCSFGNAERLNPSLEYETILMNSAKSLASRFDETVGCIKSWDSRNDDFLVIIDNMMNLELLFWASKHSNDSTYYDIAVTHANTTIKNHFRDDYSSYHVVNYNKNDGSIIKKHTAQGFSDESAWARGQAWGLYGFTVMYRETQDEIYLNQAKAIAEFILNHPNMPNDMVPYWDFNAPDIPHALRDSSAGAIMASALLELRQYVDGDLSNTYASAANAMISTLTSDEYLAKSGTNGGFLLKHGVGHIPANSEVDVPLTYGDYYLIEAMLRYKYNRI
ncbi:glycoside hydrolase family 88 protein [Aestuariibaculum sediminum]|uniref:Glycoside hydrolase family 88 protein n=1 Tax=Aestuariibaculum sediminum TaxID=2770637 RepID=A0A8J6Q0K4_9FLAO|nr:glycoside hydrolase family 88 protein [Aestuariibaculum sediminum]MBD0832537.1 glycoside hydrolase family 88 protein [Aestuariibaculum sediminum]